LCCEQYSISFKKAEFICSIARYQPSSVAQERFLDREGAENISLFCSNIAKHLHQPKTFNGSRVFAHSSVIESTVNGGLGAEHPVLGD